MNTIIIKFPGYLPERGSSSIMDVQMAIQAYLEEKLFVGIHSYPMLDHVAFVTNNNIPDPDVDFVEQILKPGILRYFPEGAEVKFMENEYP